MSSECYKLITNICDERDKGYGFVPLIGAGLSVASGIPTVREIQHYLYLTVRLALKKEWDPRSSKWLELGQLEERLKRLSKKERASIKTDKNKLNEAFKQAKERLEQLEKELELIKQSRNELKDELVQVNKDEQKWLQLKKKELKWQLGQLGSRLRILNYESEKAGERIFKWIRGQMIRLRRKTTLSSDDYLHWEAAGALADWRTTLQFLSRLEFQGKESFLGKPDNRVIDSFFFHITREKKPNLGHLMLGHLAEGLRLNTILTTNFDSLIEEAFAELDRPASTFDVHQNADLPSAGLVLAQRSVIKLHGGRYGLRANFTLDEIPSESDKHTFCRYFSDPVKPEDSETSREDRKIFQGTKRHLLVIGTSGGDRRIMNLLKFALKEITSLKVFWVCHTKKEAEEIYEAFADESPGQVHTTVHVDNGLFLIQLYQQLYLSPPPGRVDFPAFWPVAPSPYENKGSKKQKLFDKEKRQLLKIIRAVVNDTKKGALAVGGEKGVTSLAAKAAAEIAQENECLWLNLDVFHGWSDFFVSLVDSISWHLGAAPAMLPSSTDEPEACRQRLKEVLGHTPRKFVIFLNDREGKDTEGKEKEEKNARKDKKKLKSPEEEGERTWSQPSYELLLDVIGAVKGTNLTFVLLARQKSKNEFELAHKEHFECYHIKEDVIEFDAKKIADCVEGFIDSDTDRRRFVYGLSLFGHAAYLPALCSWSLIKAPHAFSVGKEKDNDEKRFQIRREWLKELRNMGAIRYNSGGFVWMHKDVRKELVDERLKQEMECYRAECHQGIADWYVKLFRSSNDPLAALESVKHRLYCIQYADALAKGAGCGDDDYLKRTALIEAGVTLSLAKDRLLSCGYHNAAISRIHDIAMEVEDHSNGNHSNSPVAEAKRLTRKCNELLRDFYREVARFKEASKCNDALRNSPETNVEQNVPATATTYDYEELIYLTGNRLYEGAEKKAIELLGSLGTSFFDALSKVGTSKLRGVPFREIGRDWINKETPSSEVIRFVISTLRRLMFLEMLIAQKYKLVSSIANQNCRHHWDCQGKWECKHQESCRLHIIGLRRSEAVYVLATELMRHVDDPNFLQTENAYIRTHYGVLLANIGRFREAHRRLNEAYGYLSQSSKRTSGTAWAVLYLRRAEVYIQQARGCTAMEDYPDKKRKIQAYLDDAHCALEQVERNLKGHRKNIWWWTWMYELQITVCVLIAGIENEWCKNHEKVARGSHEPLACRRCTETGQRCRELLKSSMELIQLDSLRQAELTRLFTKFLRYTGIKEDSFKSNLKKAKEHLEELRKAREQDFGAYFDVVISDAEES